VYSLYWYVLARLVTLFSLPQAFVSKAFVSLMPFRKINDRNSFKRKKDLLNSIDSLSLAMRSCKRYSSLEKTCTLGETSKKCICCVKTNKPCDLTISPTKLRRIYKERLRVRDAIREMKTKLYRLKH